MDSGLKQEYQKWADDMIAELHKNEEWIDIYDGYAKEMLNNEDEIKAARNTFYRYKTIYPYLCIGQAKKKGDKVFDLRYFGQSVGTLTVTKDGKRKLTVDETKAGNSKRYFGYDIGVIDDDWDSRGRKPTEFRKFFRDCKGLTPKDKNVKRKDDGIEHIYESALYTEFEKDKAKNKTLCHIQPIKFGNTRIHMKTAMPGSSLGIKVSEKGQGGCIDLFCRRKLGPKSRLVIIELKDKNETSASFDKTMKQAISYAAFIKELLYSKAGDKWRKLWSIDKQKKFGFTIDCVVAMPKGVTKPSYCGDTLDFKNNDGTTDHFALHYIEITTDIDQYNLNIENVKFESSYEKIKCQ